MELFPLNMTDEEKPVFDMLLAFGQITAGELSQYNKIELSTANSLLESLLEKGFAKKISNFGNHFFPNFPFLETHTHFKDLNNQINELDTQSKAFFDDRKNDLTAYQESKNAEITQKVTDRTNEFNKHSEDLKNNIDGTLAEFDTELKTIEENFISAINAKTEEFKSTEIGKITDNRTHHDDTIQQNQDKILETVSGHKANLETISNNFTSTIQNFSLTYLDSVYDRFKNLLDNLRADLNNLSQQFDANGKEWTKNSLDTQNSVFTDFSNVLEDNFGQFGSFLAEQDSFMNQMSIENDLDLESASSALLKFIGTINNTFIDFKKQLSTKLEEAKSVYATELDKVNGDVANFKKSSDDKIDAISGTYLQHLDTNTANYKETVATTVSTNKSEIESFTATLNTNFQTLEKTRSDSLTLIADNMKKQQEIALQTQREANSNLQDGILTPFNTQYAEIKRIKKKFFSDTTKAIDAHYKAIDAKMKEIIASFKTSFDGFTEKTQVKSDEAMGKANKDLDAFVKNEMQLVTSHMNDLKKPIPGMQSSVDKQIADIDTRLDTELSAVDQAVSTHVENTQKTLDLIQKMFVTDLNSELSTLISTTDEEDPKVTKLALLKKLQDNIAKKMQAVENNLSNSKAELNSKVLESFKKQKTDLQAKKTGLKDYLTKSSTDYFANVNKHLDDLDTSLKAKTDDLNKKLFKEIESSFTKLKGDYKSFIKEQYKTTDEYFKEQKKTLPVHKKEGIQLIKAINKIFDPELKRLDTVVKTFTTSAFTLMNSLDSVIITGIPDDLRNNVAQTRDQLAKNSSEAQAHLQEYQTTYLDSVTKMETTLHTFNDTNKGQHTTEITNMKDESHKVLGEETQATLDFNTYVQSYGNNNVETEHQEFQTLLSNAHQTVKTGLLDVIHEQQATLTTSIDKKKADFETQNNTIQERFGSISLTLDEYIGNFNNTTQERVDSRDKEVDELHNETKNKINTETSDTNTKHLTEIGNTITKHQNDYVDHHTNLKNISHDFLQIVQDDSVNFADMVRDDNTARMQENKGILIEKTNYIRTVHDHFASSVKNANDTALQMQNDLIATVGDHYTKLNEGNAGFTADFQTTVKKGLEILTPKITVLEDFERIVNGYTYPKVTTLPVIGRGSALHTLDFYLSDFKASVTLLIPNPSDIPVDLISKTKRPKRVTVASLFDLNNPSEKAMVSKLIEQDNVTVRQLSPSHDETGYPQYISADRDSEEIFFGAFDAENRAEFAGVVSSNRQYIEFIGRVITSDFLSKARKIEKV